MQEDPPQPLSDKLYFENFGPKELYASSFDGWADEWKITQSSNQVTAVPRWLYLADYTSLAVPR